MTVNREINFINKELFFVPVMILNSLQGFIVNVIHIIAIREEIILEDNDINKIFFIQFNFQKVQRI